MNKEKTLIRNLGLQLAMAGASGLLLTSPVVAQSDANDQDSQAGQPQVEVTQQSPDVNVEQAETDVSVDRKPPKVTVRQPAPEVTVTQPEPEVNVRMPKPEIEVTQQDPDINVDQSQPEVQIEQQEPEVTVQRAEPDVQVEQSEPQVEVSDSEPEVTLEREGAIDVNVEREEQQQQSQQQGLDSMSIDDLEGRTVITSDGAEIGKIDQVVVSSDQRRAGVVLSVGGILGIGANQVMAPLDRLKLEDDQLVWDTSMTKDEIKQTSVFDEQNYNNVSSENFQNVGELRQGTRQ